MRNAHHCARDDYPSAAERFFSSLSGDQRELLAAALVQKVDPVYRDTLAALHIQHSE